jgi:hypothetical protein
VSTAAAIECVVDARPGQVNTESLPVVPVMIFPVIVDVKTS